MGDRKCFANGVYPKKVYAFANPEEAIWKLFYERNQIRQAAFCLAGINCLKIIFYYVFKVKLSQRWADPINGNLKLIFRQMMEWMIPLDEAMDKAIKIEKILQKVMKICSPPGIFLWSIEENRNNQIVPTVVRQKPKTKIFVSTSCHNFRISIRGSWLYCICQWTRHLIKFQYYSILCAILKIIKPSPHQSSVATTKVVCSVH